ncbi:MAG: hydrogenase maturation nickel metallochaperone HypA [Acidobacteria bacterium]|nr:hydrogenase maturation nickel metallochaperone HypA [Acidobacteriota bacterium]
MIEHEMVTGLLEIIDHAAYRHSVSRVRTIEIELGGCRHLDADQLKQQFTIAARNTVADGAELHIHVLPVRRRCHACGTNFEADEHDRTCPHCRHPHTEALTGEEARVVAMEVELA